MRVSAMPVAAFHHDPDNPEDYGDDHHQRYGGNAQSGKYDGHASES